jgi:hypothetical protein
MILGGIVSGRQALTRRLISCAGHAVRPGL